MLAQTALLMGYFVLKSSLESNEIRLLNLSCGCQMCMDVLINAQYACVYIFSIASFLCMKRTLLYATAVC